ncbi:MAG TPA: hypothetical protein VGG85_17540 [Terracidiphilus sp.]|jgi:hypothetical protein
MRILPRLFFSIFVAAPMSIAAQQASPDSSETSQAALKRTEFHVRYVSGASIYIDGGRDAGLAEGTRIVLKQAPSKADSSKPEKALEPGILANLTVVSAASTSAVCEVDASTRDLVVGDVVTLPEAEVEKLVEKNALGVSRIYPMVVSFSEGDPLDEEVRDAIPHPPLPEINQSRGRIGFDVSTIRGLGANSIASTVVGMVVRADISRIGGTHFNLNGYWRGRVQTTSTPAQSSIQDLINRTYQMSLTYVNPASHWTAGIGRLYLPWASSLEVIDGGYVARSMSQQSYLGVFAGSTPDPTAWNYNPDRKITGAFVNTHGGDYDGFRYSSTEGAGVELLKWSVDKPFLFTENDLSFKRVFSLYHSMQIDRPAPNPGTPPVPFGIGQSLLSLRFQAHPRVEFELTDTYFRDVPTYDATLIGTGLLDKYLFQGINGGGRLQFPLRLTGYFTLGQSSASTDRKDSWNSMFGASMSRIWKTDLSVDMRYSKFESAFGSGIYRTFTVSRDLGERFRLNLQAGKQSFASPVSKDNGDYFANLLVDTNLGSRYFLESSYTTQRGGALEYNQYTATFGYRFDNRSHERMVAHAQKP